jgi:hypothetical protein
VSIASRFGAGISGDVRFLPSGVIGKIEVSSTLTDVVVYLAGSPDALKLELDPEPELQYCNTQNPRSSLEEELSSLSV